MPGSKGLAPGLNAIDAIYSGGGMCVWGHLRTACGEPYNNTTNSNWGKWGEVLYLYKL